MSILEEFFIVRDRFGQIIDEQSTKLKLVGETLDSKRCLSRDELAPILYSVQMLSEAIVEFLSVLRNAVNKSDAKSQLEKIPFNETMPDEETLQNLLSPRFLVISILNSIYKNNIQITPGWSNTYELVMWYSEYRNIVPGLFYFIQNYNRGYTADTIELWNWISDFTADSRIISAFRGMAQRAAFLISVDDERLESGEAIWWCQKVDAFPKSKDYYGVLLDLLDFCPDSEQGDVVERLKEFSSLDAVEQNSYDAEQLADIRKKAKELLSK